MNVCNKCWITNCVQSDCQVTIIVLVVCCTVHQISSTLECCDRRSNLIINTVGDQSTIVEVFSRCSNGILVTTKPEVLCNSINNMSDISTALSLTSEESTSIFNRKTVEVTSGDCVSCNSSKGRDCRTNVSTGVRILVVSSCWVSSYCKVSIIELVGNCLLHPCRSSIKCCNAFCLFTNQTVADWSISIEILLDECSGVLVTTSEQVNRNCIDEVSNITLALRHSSRCRTLIEFDWQRIKVTVINNGSDDTSQCINSRLYICTVCRILIITSQRISSDC